MRRLLISLRVYDLMDEMKYEDIRTN